MTSLLSALQRDRQYERLLCLLSDVVKNFFIAYLYSIYTCIVTVFKYSLISNCLCKARIILFFVTLSNDSLKVKDDDKDDDEEYSYKP